jgi:CMP-N-acetylneuraminic acid synthetase
VPRKNIKPFADHEYGLMQIKLAQLNKCSSIDEIVLSTNDEEILDYAYSLDMSRLRVHIREERLSSSSTSTDDLVGLAHDLAAHDHILWTHVTSPFFTSKNYDEAITVYFANLAKGYDSLMTVKEMQGFFWDDGGPVNYDRKLEKWPRTQTVSPLYEVDSAVFLNSRNNYSSLKDRIGLKPKLFASPGMASFDIDLPEEFLLGELLLKNALAFV